MRATRTVEWAAKNGKQVNVTIEVAKEVKQETAFADGCNVALGEKTIDTISIEVTVDGTHATRSFHKPEIIVGKPSYKRMTDAGAYARLGDLYIAEEQHNLIMATIEEINATEETGEEFETLKAQEEKEEIAKTEANSKEDKDSKRLQASGLCPKCNTWCYGDCEAN